MPSDLVELASDEFRVVAAKSGTRLESRSGAGVHAVRTASREAAYLKVTPASAGSGALAAARRELRFYLELAPVVPVRTPRLLNSSDSEKGVAVLLAAAGKPRPVALWTVEMWTTLGENVAALHGMPVPVADSWHRPDALLAALADPNMVEINDFWANVLPTLATLISRLADLRERIESLPPAFVHGDCHLDNIVHGSGSLVFCDWQATGVGRPAADLAFLSVRTTPSGTTVPRALLDAYLGNRPYDRHALESVLLAEELATYLLLWPPYAAFNSHDGIGRVHRRTRELAGRFLADPEPRERRLT